MEANQFYHCWNTCDMITYVIRASCCFSFISLDKEVAYVFYRKKKKIRSVSYAAGTCEAVIWPMTYKRYVER